MNLLTSSSVLALLTLSNKEQEAFSGIITILAGVVGQQAAHNPQVQEVMSALKGETLPPRWLAAMGEWIKRMSAYNSLDVVPKTIKAFCDANQVSYESLVSGMRKISKTLGVETIETDPDVFLKQALLELSDKLLPINEGAVQFKGIVQCPNCKYTFLV
jgi:hypothetical protein